MKEKRANAFAAAFLMAGGGIADHLWLFATSKMTE
jgi:Zn-dependent peptidase ImmA (M78 family)